MKKRKNLKAQKMHQNRSSDRINGDIDDLLDLLFLISKKILALNPYEF